MADRETSTLEPTFAEFCAAVRKLLDETAISKGYRQAGPGSDLLYALVNEIANGPGHPLGEIVMKATRYAARGNLEDLEKIAAWSFLI